MNLLTQIRIRPQLFSALLVGIAAGLLAPGSVYWVKRWLLGWNAGVWLYLVLIWSMMLRADHTHIRRVAVEHAEAAAAVLLVVVAGVVASLVAIVVELARSRADSSDSLLLNPLLITLATVAASWLLLPTLFTLAYASQYYRDPKGPGSGLEFPKQDERFRPDYTDFMYFSVTIAICAQTSDVQITSPRTRKLATLQAMLGFAFNTLVLAMSINIAAGLFGR